MNTDTPYTDSAIVAFESGQDQGPGVAAGFARRQEKEIYGLREENIQLRIQLSKCREAKCRPPKTPMTDDQEALLHEGVVGSDFARFLELDNAELREALEQWLVRDSDGNYPDEIAYYTPTLHPIAAMALKQ